MVGETNGTVDAPGRVLVCEDDPGMLALIEGALQVAGLDVQVASEGRAGLAMATASTPDAIVVDWLMPGLDGISLCSAARENPSLATAHIVLVTGRTEPEYAQIASDAGADAVVTKPFDPMQLAEDVKAGVRRSRAARRAVTASRTDPVTGLRDERCLREDLDRILALTETLQRPFPVAVAVGMVEGDADLTGALEAAAGSLAAILGPADALYRLDDASFAVLAPDADEPELLEAAIAAGIRRAGLTGHDVATAGVCVHAGVATDVLATLRRQLHGG
jgi:CheY-like chemotaxis protein